MPTLSCDFDLIYLPHFPSSFPPVSLSKSSPHHYLSPPPLHPSISLSLSPCLWALHISLSPCPSSSSALYHAFNISYSVHSLLSFPADSTAAQAQISQRIRTYSGATFKRHFNTEGDVTSNIMTSKPNQTEQKNNYCSLPPKIIQHIYFLMMQELTKL